MLATCQATTYDKSTSYDTDLRIKGNPCEPPWKPPDVITNAATHLSLRCAWHTVSAPIAGLNALRGAESALMQTLTAH
ncbi:hypothetical protein Pfra02_33720 [Pseudomonas fragi]|nr:hypothetical protein Pfra02_33720 [Pseudomonas fragi]